MNSTSILSSAVLDNPTLSAVQFEARDGSILTQETARQELSVQGNWPTRSASFSPADAAFDIAVIAAFRRPDGEFDIPAFDAYLGEPWANFGPFQN